MTHLYRGMHRRAFIPGTDGDRERVAAGKRPIYRDKGDVADPAHGQRVILVLDGAEYEAVYDRDQRSFSLDDGMPLPAPKPYVVNRELVGDYWTQLPPQPRRGFSMGEFA